MDSTGLRRWPTQAGSLAQQALMESTRVVAITDLRRLGCCRTGRRRRASAPPRCSGRKAEIGFHGDHNRAWALPVPSPRRPPGQPTTVSSRLGRRRTPLELCRGLRNAWGSASPISSSSWRWPGGDFPDHDHIVLVFTCSCRRSIFPPHASRAPCRPAPPRRRHILVQLAGKK